MRATPISGLVAFLSLLVVGCAATPLVPPDQDPDVVAVLSPGRSPLPLRVGLVVLVGDGAGDVMDLAGDLPPSSPPLMSAMEDQEAPLAVPQEQEQPPEAEAVAADPDQPGGAYPMGFDPQQAQRLLRDGLTRLGVFDEVHLLPMAAARAGRDALIAKAFAEGLDAVLVIDLGKSELAYLGVNGWFIPNVILWLHLWGASWFVRDEIYAWRLGISWELIAVASEQSLVGPEEAQLEVRHALDDFERGFRILDMFRLPECLDDENWRRIGDTLRPHLEARLVGHLATAMAEPLDRQSQAAALESRLSTVQAVVVGVERYRDTRIPLCRHARDDGAAWAASLRERGVPAKNIEELVGVEASRERLLESLRRVARRARPGDTLLVVFSGAGALQVTEGSGQGGRVGPVVLPHDADLEKLEETAISTDELGEALSDTRAGRVLVVLDTAFGRQKAGRGAGSLIPGSQQSEAIMAALRDLSDRDGWAMVVACGPQGGAYSIGSRRRGLFSYYLLEALAGRADLNADGQISLSELESWTVPLVETYAGKEGLRQRPLFMFRGTSSDETALVSTSQGQP